MKHRVFWTPYAENDYAALLRASKNPDEYRKAADFIDRSLAIDPADFGESRGDGTRIAFEFPLAVRFEIWPDDPTVIVSAVWSMRR